MLINADRFLLVSNQRNYFYEQKHFYQSEIERLTGLFQKAYHKKKSYKVRLDEKEMEIIKRVEPLNKEIQFLRSKVSI